MKLEDLKSVWKAAASRDANKKSLDSEEIKSMLSKRSMSIIEKINVNVKIGFVIILAIILLMIADNAVMAPVYQSWIDNYVNQPIEIPGWIITLSYVQIALAIVGCIYFWVCYNRVNRKNISSENIKQSLKSFIDVFVNLKKLTKVFLLFFAVVLAISMTTGLYIGLQASSNMANVTTSSYLMIFGIGAALFSLIVFGVFKVLQLIFRRLFGKYLSKLYAYQEELKDIE
ncbi:hypothetical protein EMN47_06090 [Prolixibacteraceae bacterium JC049]|nr:hypothetical protein [Prolixibacteraceae bacterium JC049]